MQGKVFEIAKIFLGGDFVRLKEKCLELAGWRKGAFTRA